MTSRRRKEPLPLYYTDEEVTLERLEAFASAPRDKQVAVLARLHKEEADDSHTAELALFGIGLALATGFSVPEKIDLSGLPLLPQLVVSFMLGGVAVLLLIPAIISAHLGTGKRTRAAVWARAYETELNRPPRPVKRRWFAFGR